MHSIEQKTAKPLHDVFVSVEAVEADDEPVDESDPVDAEKDDALADEPVDAEKDDGLDEEDELAEIEGK